MFEFERFATQSHWFELPSRALGYDEKKNIYQMPIALIWRTYNVLKIISAVDTHNTIQRSQQRSKKDKKLVQMLYTKRHTSARQQKLHDDHYSSVFFIHSFRSFNCDSQSCVRKKRLIALQYECACLNFHVFPSLFYLLCSSIPYLFMCPSRSLPLCFSRLPQYSMFLCAFFMFAICSSVGLSNW